MTIEKVRQYFNKFNMEDRVIEFDDSSATVSLAAERLGVNEDNIVKSLAFETKEGPILILMSGQSKVDNKKYKETFKTKAKMISPEDLVEKIGHVMGGVCPFCIKENVEVYLDQSLKKLDIMYPAAGTSSSAVRLNLEELEKYSNPRGWVDLNKEEK